MSFDAGQDSTTNPNNAQSTSSGGGSSHSSTNNQSSSFRDPSSIWGGQSPYLQDLYGMAGNQAGNGWQQNQNNAQYMFGRAMRANDRLMSPGVNPQQRAYSQEVQRNLEQNLLPSIQGNAGQMGQMGGARQGVAEGVALQGANQDITNMAANLYSEDMNRMGAAAAQVPSLATFGQQIPWYAMNQYSGILGSPTQMQGAAGSQSTGSSSSSSSDWSESQSTNIGGGTGDQGWNLGFGIYD